MATTATQLKFRGIAHKQKSILNKVQKTIDYVYDEQNDLLLGRPPLRWLWTILLYLIFYAVLFSFTGVMLAIFLYTVMDANYPMRYGMETPLQRNPGLGMRPMPNYQSTLIRFIQGDPSTYKVHTDQIQTFLDQYENDKQVGENFIDCSQGREGGQEQSVCRFDVDKLGPECTWQKDYGFDEGMPCVLLKINKIYGWKPEPLDEAPPGVENFRKSHLKVTCEGETPPDKENIGNLTFWPPYGFSTDYFPYLNQEDYRQPIVFVRFERPRNGVIINVWCKVWGKGIYHHRDDVQGSIHFELLVD